MSQGDSCGTHYTGPGFCGLLFIVLLCLKLGIGDTRAVDWSWWIITLPLWGGVAILVTILACIAIAWVILVMYKIALTRKRKK